LTDLPEGECDVLWNDGEFILSRVRNQSDCSPMLLVRPSQAHLTAASYARLNHAYALRDELEVSWGARHQSGEGGGLPYFVVLILALLYAKKEALP
jgi:hypothetical protein